MRKITDNDLKLLESLFKQTQEKLLKFTGIFLRKYYPQVVITKDYIFAEGTIPVALVAHLDTVFKQPPVEIYYDERKGVMWSPDGLGADDRAGVFAILKLIQKGYRPHIIFTTDEEWGGLGAWQLAYDYPYSPFKKLNYIIELDRCNNNDCVFYTCINKKFIDFWEDLGFCEAVGLYSDICELSPEWKVCSVNLSVGYRDEHTYTEILKLPALFQTIDKVEHVLKTPELYNRTFTWQCYIPPKTITCDRCGKKVSEDEIFLVQTSSDKTEKICCDCVIDGIEWCEQCHEPFIVNPQNKTEKVCYKCKEKK